MPPVSKAPMPDSATGEAPPMPSSFDDDLEFWDESRWSKLTRRLKEEPLIPLGLGLTCLALFNASRSMRKGDKESTNKYFRARVYAQGFTLLCVCVGAVYYREDREKRKHYQGLLGEKRAQEKKEAWLRELEARDEEDKAEKARRDALRERKKEAREGRKVAGSTDVEESNASPLDGENLRGLVLGSRILGPAMSRWWSGK